MHVPKKDQLAPHFLLTENLYVNLGLQIAVESNRDLFKLNIYITFLIKTNIISIYHKNYILLLIERLC